MKGVGRACWEAADATSTNAKSPGVPWRQLEALKVYKHVLLVCCYPFMPADPGITSER